MLYFRDGRKGPYRKFWQLFGGCGLDLSAFEEFKRLLECIMVLCTGLLGIHWVESLHGMAHGIMFWVCCLLSGDDLQLVAKVLAGTYCWGLSSSSKT